MIKTFLNFQFSIFKKKEGFTLIELLIFMGVFSIIIVILTQLLISIFDVQLESQSTAVVSQDARYILNKFTNDIKSASSSSILNPAIGATGSALAVKKGSTTYTYSLSNGNLIVNEDQPAAANQLNSINTTVSNLSFSIHADLSGQYNTVTVSFTVVSKVVKRNGTYSENYSLTTGTR